MFDIITIEPDDSVVMAAVNTITQGKAIIAKPKDGYRVFARDALHVEGAGGSADMLIIVGHASADSLSGCKTWKGFAEQVTASASPNWNASDQFRHWPPSPSEERSGNRKRKRPPTQVGRLRGDSVRRGLNEWVEARHGKGEFL